VPKQIYVRGHYRRSRKQKSALWLGILVCIAFVLLFGAQYPAVFIDGILLVSAVLCAFFIIRWSKKRTAVVPDNRPAVQSRYIPEDMKRFVMRRDNYQCRSCGSELYPEIDHIIPFSLGGPTHPDNLQVLCRGCNSQKRARVYANG